MTPANNPPLTWFKHTIQQTMDACDLPGDWAGKDGGQGGGGLWSCRGRRGFLNNETKTEFLKTFFLGDQFTFGPGAVAILILAEPDWSMDLTDPPTVARLESRARVKVRELRQKPEAGA
jgi:hypothetical protein